MIRSRDSDSIIILLQDVLRSSSSSGFVIGLSGGIDSSVAATLCVRAAGCDHVQGFFLPSAVTPSQDADDVTLLAEFLQIPVLTIPIDPFIDQYRMMPGFTETSYLVGNLMARIRMTILYYYANQMNRLVCGTSNYTEYVLGYCTKFGDNAADVQPIIHLQKSEVWSIAEHLGIPHRLIEKTPSAGLWHNQTDENELGMKYDVIDAAISHLEEQGWEPRTLEEEWVVEKMQRAGHKQRPAPQVYR
ncbi:MAG TPA: NAD(+) synthase [Methanospirillum sp.]|uniref:NAD(+) synthase n=1 Tax=Methanospirillum sp. TaxID=45200 RepID=UPI002C1AB5C8|nr:NAD(+) synthase [Methanospirillum sp.]HOJ97144.1 NAD(+) synthase [Methanospirillum sp.]HOL41552.1 NAD(+) synthase [Methanospirillum sp.]